MPVIEVKALEIIISNIPRWKDRYKYWTEVAMALNHRCWYWHTRNEDMMQLYRDLYYKADGWAKCSMNAKELFFYAEVMD